MSYFEWLKNLSHVRFGRIAKRHEEANERQMLKAIELATGTRFTEEQRSALAKGPDELDLVNSGLEETMINAYNGLRDTRKVAPRRPRPAHGRVPHRHPQGGEELHGTGHLPLGTRD